MSTVWKLRHFALLAALLLAGDAWALQMGRVRGAVLIGRPLNIGVQLLLDNPAEADSLCLAAEVFHGDSRVDPAQISLNAQTLPDGTTMARLSSPVLVDEPVVVVTLRAGCAERVARRYVLLAEYLTDAAQEPAAARAAPVAPTPLAAPGPAPKTAASAPIPAPIPAPSPRAASAALPMARLPGRAAPSLAQAAPSRRAQSPAPAVARAAPRGDSSQRGRPQLKLEPLDLGGAKAPAQGPGGGAPSVPSAGAEPRAGDQATQQALNAQRDDIARVFRRMEKLEADARILQELMQKNTAALTLMTEQVEKARSERNLLATMLVGLLLLVAVLGVGLAVAGMMWMRRRDSAATDWWHDERGGADAGKPWRPAAAPAMAQVDAVSQAQGTEALVRPATDVAPAPPKVAEGDGDDARPGRSAAAPARERPMNPDFLISLPGTMRMVSVDELIDIQQQAAFFASLGQTDRAADVLETHIRTVPETSALVWLDLLDLYYNDQRRDEYERLRDNFQRIFNAEVPAFDKYNAKEGGLENYDRALSRIVALWPRQEVLDVIEESLVRRPGVPAAAPFDLEAYRELMLLFNIAQEVLKPAAVETLPKAGTFRTGPTRAVALPKAGRAQATASASADAVDFWAGDEKTDRRRIKPTGHDTDLQPLSSLHDIDGAGDNGRSPAWWKTSTPAARSGQSPPVDIDLGDLSPPD